MHPDNIELYNKVKLYADTIYEKSSAYKSGFQPRRKFQEILVGNPRFFNLKKMFSYEILFISSN